MVGQTIGKYRVVSRLGRGGMGTVYKAVDETLDREVAIKCLNPDIAEPDVLKRFRAEAVMLARLNHPNIATLFELTEHDGQLLMVMEFVRGETFDQMSTRVGAMPIDRAAHLCVQVLDALASAHRAGVVHRDLKLANLMLTESGRTKVMDFGIARMAGGERLTNNGFMVGTPAYMSPEQVLGGEIDGRADLYSMGVVFYRLLTAQLPFKADSGIAMAHKQLHDMHTPVRQLRMELPAECEEILTRALAKAPGDRYPTADHFKAALEVLSGAASAEMMPTLSLPSLAPLSSLDPTPWPQPPGITVTALKPAPAAETGIAPPVLPPPPLPAASTRRRMPVAAAIAIGAIGAVLLAGVPAVLLWRARAAKPQAATIQASPPPASTIAEAAPPVPPASGLAEPAPSAPAVPVAKPSTGAATVKKSEAPPVPVGSPSGGAPVTASGAKTEAAPPAREASVPASVPPPLPAALPTVSFAKMKLLVLDEGKSRDRDASLRLGPDALEVLDGERTVQSTPYGDVIGFFHSHSREPRWATPNGDAVPVLKVDGKFGFLKGTPDWITVRTKSGFIPLRVPDEELRRVIAQLEARTGSKVVRVR